MNEKCSHTHICESCLCMPQVEDQDEADLKTDLGTLKTFQTTIDYALDNIDTALTTYKSMLA